MNRNAFYHFCSNLEQHDTGSKRSSSERVVRALALVFLLSIYGPVLAGAANYTYDAVGRLTQITYDDGTTITYTYDKAGNRVTRTVTTT